jgi:hypothetical protein
VSILPALQLADETDYSTYHVSTFGDVINAESVSINLQTLISKVASSTNPAKAIDYDLELEFDHICTISATFGRDGIKTLGNFGVCELLCSLSSYSLQSPRLTALLLTALSCLCRFGNPKFTEDIDNINKMTRCGACEIAINALSTYKNSKNVLTKGLILVRNLSYDNSNASIFYGLQACDILINIYRRCMMDVKVVEFCVSAIVSLVSYNDENRVAFCGLKADYLLFHTINIFFEDDLLCEIACDALLFLCVNENVKVKCASCDNIYVLFRLQHYKKITSSSLIKKAESLHLILQA